MLGTTRLAFSDASAVSFDIAPAAGRTAARRASVGSAASSSAMESASTASRLTLKLSFGTAIHRMTVASVSANDMFDQVVASAATLFNLPADTGAVGFKWCDDDGDWISVSSSVDMSEFLKFQDEQRSPRVPTLAVVVQLPVVKFAQMTASEITVHDFESMVTRCIPLRDAGASVATDAMSVDEMRLLDAILSSGDASSSGSSSGSYANSAAGHDDQDDASSMGDELESMYARRHRYAYLPLHASYTSSDDGATEFMPLTSECSSLIEPSETQSIISCSPSMSSSCPSCSSILSSHDVVDSDNVSPTYRRHSLTAHVEHLDVIPEIPAESPTFDDQIDANLAVLVSATKALESHFAVNSITIPRIVIDLASDTHSSPATSLLSSPASPAHHADTVYLDVPRIVIEDVTGAIKRYDPSEADAPPTDVPFIIVTHVDANDDSDFYDDDNGDDGDDDDDLDGNTLVAKTGVAQVSELQMSYDTMDDDELDSETRVWGGATTSAASTISAPGSASAAARGGQPAAAAAASASAFDDDFAADDFVVVDYGFGNL
ncbi:hypothetical protein BC831DRAFT_454029 [Entophlyctis helioformis]|nr:hypothetical protein BC831DRAFT_454029 [Entophlyctis helioformis]